MELNLKGKTVIVTGSASNIGHGIAVAFAKEGSRVVVADLDETKGAKVAEELEAIKSQAMYVKTNVVEYASVENMVAKTIQEFGQVDVLVNCVGWVMDRLFIEKPRAEWEKEVNLNLWSYINCTKAVIDHMIGRKSGKIVNISSDAGRIGEYREVVYSACKGGVIAMSRALAKEVGRYGININTICPGVIIPDKMDASQFSMWSGGLADVFTPEAKEKMIKSYPLRRLGKPEEVANAVVFMASSAADYITGQTLSVSGGYTTV